MDPTQIVGPDIEIFDEWVNKNYGGNSRTKTITREKYNKICKLLRGKDPQCNAKFRFWVRNKGFILMKHNKNTDEIVNDLQGDLYVSLHAKEENAPTGEYSIATFLRTNLPAISFYRKVAVVDEFHGIIKQAHVDMKGSHAGQKKTYRLVSDTFAFLPREVITYFLLNCETCKPRIQKYGPVPKKNAAKAKAQSQQIENQKLQRHVDTEQSYSNGNNTSSKHHQMTNNAPINEEHPIVHILDDSGHITTHDDISKNNLDKKMPTLVSSCKRSFEDGTRPIEAKRLREDTGLDVEDLFIKQRIKEEKLIRLRIEEERLLRDRIERDHHIRRQMEKECIMRRRYDERPTKNYEVISQLYAYREHPTHYVTHEKYNKHFDDRKNNAQTEVSYKIQHSEDYKKHPRYENLRFDIVPHPTFYGHPHHFYHDSRQKEHSFQQNLYEHYTKRKYSAGSSGNDTHENTSNHSHSPSFKDNPWSNSPEAKFLTQHADMKPYWKSPYESENSSPRSPKLYSSSSPRAFSGGAVVHGLPARNEKSLASYETDDLVYGKTFKHSHYHENNTHYFKGIRIPNKYTVSNLVEEYHKESVVESIEDENVVVV